MRGGQNRPKTSLNSSRLAKSMGRQNNDPYMMRRRPLVFVSKAGSAFGIQLVTSRYIFICLDGKYIVFDGGVASAVSRQQLDEWIVWGKILPWILHQSSHPQKNIATSSESFHACSWSTIGVNFQLNDVQWLLNQARPRPLNNKASSLSKIKSTLRWIGKPNPDQTDYSNGKLLRSLSRFSNGRIRGMWCLQ